MLSVLAKHLRHATISADASEYLSMTNAPRRNAIMDEIIPLP